MRLAGRRADLQTEVKRNNLFFSNIYLRRLGWGQMGERLLFLLGFLYMQSASEGLQQLSHSSANTKKLQTLLSFITLNPNQIQY